MEMINSDNLGHKLAPVGEHQRNTHLRKKAILIIIQQIKIIKKYQIVHIMNTRSEIWIGILGLYPLKNNEYIEQNQGAYSNFLIIASSFDDYLEKAHKFAEWLDFEIFNYDDIKPLRVLKKSVILNEEFSVLEKKIRTTKETQISTLNVFNVGTVPHGGK